jgi:hypothetical protein
MPVRQVHRDGAVPMQDRIIFDRTSGHLKVNEAGRAVSQNSSRDLSKM